MIVLRKTLWLCQYRYI